MPTDEERNAADAERDAANATRDVANLGRDAANVDRDTANLERDATNADRDKAVRAERGERRKGTASVLRFARQIRVILVLQFVVIAAGAIVFTYTLFQNRALSQKNEDAIEVGCTLLKDAIVQSGAARDPGAAASPQSRFNDLLVAKILKDLSPADLAKAERLQAQIAKGPGVSIPDCALIAKRPETVLPSAKR